MVELNVAGIMLEPKSQSPIVVLKDKEDRRALLIWVGEFEANAILLGLEKMASPRPLTHDLMLSGFSALGAELRQMRITEIRNNTYYAELEFVRDGQCFVVDSRPSDAIALAVRAQIPVQVAESVMESSSVPVSPSEEEEEAERFRKFLESVKPSDFGTLGSS